MSGHRTNERRVSPRDLSRRVRQIAWTLAIAASAAGAYFAFRSEADESTLLAPLAQKNVEPSSPDANAVVAAPEIARALLEDVHPTESATEPPQGAKTVAKSASRIDFHSILAFIHWNFQVNAASAQQVIDNPSLNPKGVRLSGAQMKELEAILERNRKVIRMGERAMAKERLRCIRERYAAGVLPHASRNSTGEYLPPISSEPEVEVSLCGVGSTVHEFRAAWGDDPEYDRSRMQVFYLKRDAVNSVTNFLASHAP